VEETFERGTIINIYPSYIEDDEKGIRSGKERRGYHGGEVLREGSLNS